MLKGAPGEAGGDPLPGERVMPYLHTAGDFGDYHVATEGLLPEGSPVISSVFLTILTQGVKSSPLQLSPY